MRIIISSALIAIMLLGAAPATFAATRDHSYKTQPTLMNDNAPLWSLHGLAFWQRFE